MTPLIPGTTAATPTPPQGRVHSRTEDQDPRPAILAQGALAALDSGRMLPLSGSSQSLGSAASPTTSTSPLRDALNNPNVASHFETAVSLAVLESKGPGALEVDKMAKNLATTLKKLEPHLDAPIFDKKGHPTTLRQVLEKGILRTTAPAAPGTEDSAFLGRCIDSAKEPHNTSDWTRLGGLKWLINQLEMDCTSESYNHNNLLVKIKAFADFGELLTDLIATEKPTSESDSQLLFLLSYGREVPTMTPENIITMNFFSNALGYEDLGEFLPAFSTIKGLTRNPAFNTLRERDERLPLLGDGSTLRHGQHLHPQTGKAMGYGVLIEGEFFPLLHPLTARPIIGGGCGNVYTQDSVHPEDLHTSPETAAAVIAALQEGKRSRKFEGAPVTNTSRPGFCADDGFKSHPTGFEFLEDEIARMSYPRSIGVNRWNVEAGFSEMCHERGLPVVGAHSGTTADIMIACELLARKELTQSQTNLLSVMIHAYMAYGACHSMAEVLCVVDAVRDGTQFTPQKGLPEFMPFYEDYMERAIHAVGEEPSATDAPVERTGSSFSLMTSTSSDAIDRTASSDDLSRSATDLSTELARARTASSISLEVTTPRQKLERAHSSLKLFCTPQVVEEIITSGRTISQTSRESKQQKANRVASERVFIQIKKADAALRIAHTLFLQRLNYEERRLKIRFG